MVFQSEILLMRNVLGLALTFVLGCSPASSDPPTVDEVEQECIDIGGDLVAECTDELDVQDMLKVSKPTSYDDCSSACDGAPDPGKCWDACELLPEVVAWRNDVDAAVASLHACEAPHLAPFLREDLAVQSVLEDCGFDVSLLCATERALVFFENRDSIVERCSDWAIGLGDG